MSESSIRLFRNARARLESGNGKRVATGDSMLHAKIGTTASYRILWREMTILILMHKESTRSPVKNRPLLRGRARMSINVSFSPFPLTIAEYPADLLPH